MERIEHKIPEGYEARIEGDKVIMEPKESEDERIRKRLVEYFNGYYEKYSCRNNVNVHWEGLEVKKVLAWLEKQKEQKPAEWSEEDKKKLNIICEILNGFNGDCDGEVDWLQFLPERFNPQPHWKPSEEQMYVLNRAISELESKEHIAENYKPLKKLRDQLKKLL